MSRTPPPAGFRFRPRSRPYRAMLWTLGVMQVWVVLGLGWLWWSWQQDSFTNPLFMLVPALLMPTLLSLSLHATWGGKPGEVPAPLQLRQWPELRNLPELPPLRPAQLLAVYTLPALLLFAVFYASGVGSAWSSLQRLNNPERLTAFWSSSGWVQVSCAEMPLAGKTEQSLCYARLQGSGGALFEFQLKEWLQARYTTFGTERGDFQRQEHPLPDINTVYGGGLLSGAAELVVPNESIFGRKDYPYHLRFLARDERARGEPLPPGVPQPEADWMQRQPFAGIIMLTPQQ
ncbi:hypothetical protein GCM10017783_03810 [Deinococcus piscis]|uniref:DUF4131 domain-containing protein n=1 Tax=Deinococcus piscis TaxID=394230 RepID=A0ABQ3K4N8_9DEIO|nr:hypothetical protein [Deinococcus piscis]GHF95152.1 hypothetical protein GCM10017783_03810 [Deinococcus piscis]